MTLPLEGLRLVVSGYELEQQEHRGEADAQGRAGNAVDEQKPHQVAASLNKIK